MVIAISEYVGFTLLPLTLTLETRAPATAENDYPCGKPIRSIAVQPDF